jgi:hypothetical protein
MLVADGPDRIFAQKKGPGANFLNGNNEKELASKCHPALV